MLDFISHPHFMLVQGILLCVSICFVFSKKGLETIFNNSPFYNIIIVLLIISSTVISFIELKWWVAILYVIVSFNIEFIIANILTNSIIPKEYFHPTELKIHPSSSDKISSLYILLNHFAMVLLLVISIYVIIF